jgi:hypothetical protein
VAEPVERATVASLFARAAATCHEAIAVHLAEEPSDVRFRRAVVFALGALAGTAAREDIGADDLRVVRDATADAAAVCRTRPPEPAIVAAVTQLEEAALACDEALGIDADWSRARPLRFRFADADVGVLRAGRRWHVQAGPREATATLLDEALAQVLDLTNRRIAALTVQILDWFERAAA